MLTGCSVDVCFSNPETSGWASPASRASTAPEFAGQLRRALAEPGPHLIEAVVPLLG
jgi:acetolactate synthase I/II/III large subunit